MTLDQVNALTPAERNRKIAEICGWEYQNQKCRSFPVWKNPEGEIRYAWRSDDINSCLPNYCGSLDACAKMEKAMEEDEQIEGYLEALTFTTGGDVEPNRPSFTAYFASSDQRSKAFLMVMLP